MYGESESDENPHSESGDSSYDTRTKRTTKRTYEMLITTLDALPIQEQLDLHCVLKKKLRNFSTKGIKTVLLKYYPQDFDIIDEISYVRPYYHNMSTGIITEPEIIFENDDTICFSHEFGGVYCYSKNRSGETIPLHEKDKLSAFGYKVYNTLINADID
jgi:hypothetical protein